MLKYLELDEDFIKPIKSIGNLFEVVSSRERIKGLAEKLVSHLLEQYDLTQ